MSTQLTNEVVMEVPEVKRLSAFYGADNIYTRQEASGSIGIAVSGKRFGEAVRLIAGSVGIFKGQPTFVQDRYAIDAEGMMVDPSSGRGVLHPLSESNIRTQPKPQPAPPPPPAPEPAPVKKPEPSPTPTMVDPETPKPKAWMTREEFDQLTVLTTKYIEMQKHAEKNILETQPESSESTQSQIRFNEMLAKQWRASRELAEVFLHDVEWYRSF